jgi:hypothetical protein
MKTLTALMTAAVALAGCSGPGVDGYPEFYNTQVVVVPTDDDLHRLLLGADEQWEGVGVRPGFITVTPPGPVGAGVVVAMWSTTEELSAMWGERAVAGAVYWAGGIVFIARDVAPELHGLIAVHELGHLLAPDRDDMPCHDNDVRRGMMCDAIAAPLLTHDDVAWVCGSAAEPCYGASGG